MTFLGIPLKNLCCTPHQNHFNKYFCGKMLTKNNVSKSLYTLICQNLGHLKVIYFPFGTVLKHIKVLETTKTNKTS